jgi:hypothetical protein
LSHFHVGFFEFLVWAMYYFIMKAIILFLNIEARRNRWHVPAGVSGLFS